MRLNVLFSRHLDKYRSIHLTCHVYTYISTPGTEVDWTFLDIIALLTRLEVKIIIELSILKPRVMTVSPVLKSQRTLLSSDRISIVLFSVPYSILWTRPRYDTYDSLFRHLIIIECMKTSNLIETFVNFIKGSTCMCVYCIQCDRTILYLLVSDSHICVRSETPIIMCLPGNFIQPIFHMTR